MKKIIKTLALLCFAIVISFTCFACDIYCGKNPNNDSGNYDNGQNEIEDVTPTYNSISEATSALSSSLSSEQKNSTLPTNYVSNQCEITSSGNYYFSSSITNAITIAKNAGNVHIWLDNANITAEDDSAISAAKGAYVIITLTGTNSLTTSLRSKNKSKHAVSCKENLTINGSGTLTITSTKSAISCDKAFIGLGGTLVVTAEKHAITADTVYFNGLTLNAVSCGKDVLHAESDYDQVETEPEFNFAVGYVYIESGAINTTTVYGDAIQADSFVYIKDGTFNLNTTPTWNNAYVAVANQEKGMFDVSTHQKVSRYSVRAGSTYATLEESVKGIKVGEIDYYLSTDTAQENELTVESDKCSIVIEGGTFNINTVDDSIHANSGSVLIYGGTVNIETSDDGIHADANLKISGDADITISNCYEGIEAETIEIVGGKTTITALDDGVNTTNSNLTESQQKQVCQINISGGILDVTVSTNGDRDGIDSNGGIKITGGIVVARGPNNQNACPLDADNAVSITGGTVIIGYAPGSSNGGGMGGPGGGRPGMQGSSSFTSTHTQTKSSSKELSSGNHTVVVSDLTVSYYNAYSYSGYATVYAAATAVIN